MDSYKWGKVSKAKLLDTISETSFINQIVSFENTHFEQNSTEINKASNDLNNKKKKHLTDKSCRVVDLKKTKKS